MSWSLQLRNGDLFHRDGHYSTIQGPAKIVQDIRSEILERMGHDDLHLDFGSTIDGGITPEGIEVKGIISMIDIDEATMTIESEIRRIEESYQERQLARMEADIQTYGRTTLRRDEILNQIGPIQFKQVGDTLFVHIKIIPMSGVPQILDIPLSS